MSESENIAFEILFEGESEIIIDIIAIVVVNRNNNKNCLKHNIL